MRVDYQNLVERLTASGETFSVLTMQSSPLVSILHSQLGNRMKAIFSAEHGFFGMAAAGEKTGHSVHPHFGVPIFSLYGETRHPTDEMLVGTNRIVMDLRDIGVRCYTFLSTMKIMLEECAKRSIAVTVLDTPIPLGGIVDGPMRLNEYSSFVAAINVPLCHGMTPGECALWIKADEGLDVRLEVVKVRDWNHSCRDPWLNFFPPSPAIRSIDSAAMYPLTVFTEAYPALDCDRAGPMAFRAIGAPWMDRSSLMHKLAPELNECGVGMRPYRYSPASGDYVGRALDGIMFSVENADKFRPVKAGTLVWAELMQNHAGEMSRAERPEWLDKLTGSTAIREALADGKIRELLQHWEDERDGYLETRVNLY